LDVKKLVYGTGMAGAMVGAFLVGSVALQPVFAQSAPASPPAAQQVSPTGQPTRAEKAEKPNKAGDAEVDEATEAAALQAKAKITAEQAKQAALAQFPGATVGKTELGDENGAVVYEVALVDAKGAKQEVHVDATTGAVVAHQADLEVDNQADGETAD
jgi:hypothetical protein